jgi:hypothetical protein
MANRRIGWQEANNPRRANNGKVRETRAESVRPGNPAVTQGGNW